MQRKHFFFIFILSLPLFLKAEFIVKSYQELKNERTIRQQYEESCGASSLATLINLIADEKLSEEDILKLIDTKELYTDMLSFAQLHKLAKKLTYEAKSYKLTRANLDKLIGIPMLVKIEDDPRFPHFVIIINHKGDFLQVLDPSHGEYLSLKSQFFSIWDKDNLGGYALILAPKKDLKSFDLSLPSKMYFDFQTLH